METALIIFVRPPILGKVKTRLAKTIGDVKALEIYKELLQHTHSITQTLPCDKYVFYTDNIKRNDIWENSIYHKEVQSGNELGTRMSTAFEGLIQKRYQHICIIGSDCFELTTDIIQQAFNMLQQYDVVIGPSADGGYYLLGLNNMHPLLFTNIQWSTCNVLEQTIAACIASNCSHILLPMLHDIDDEKDWIQHQTKQAAL
ncbi:glycosyltransferase [Ilyomonas limi]|uniref:Glycosyltransferase n=1 Tax=Ilyomonas limi TaxID=2575867 RepID=A0A4U3L8Z7_9BACT|nr:glycosyltransferase [Ilyomonas limi]